ncbi:hypothetical protein FN961_25485 [Shewanella hanedai]|uniref:Bacterial toxin 33 domain-containing protein n=2 Tax=Shewanella hanedai TaxID=25 RepID=A0A553JCL1_SHEHA|nr:hypothetical protein FN961_25485 [Shewanella hanedai]
MGAVIIGAQAVTTKGRSAVTDIRNGNLRKLKDKYLKDLGIDAHAAKEVLNGTNKRNARFDLMVDKKSGQVFQKTKDGTIIPSDYSLDELKDYAPIDRK